MKLLISVAVSLAMTAGSAMAQQKGLGSDDRPQFNSITFLVAIESVQKDLGIGDDVAWKLKLLRDECQAANKREFENAGIPIPWTRRLTDEERQKSFEVMRKLNNEFNPKATELLSDDQVKRLQQIRLQGRLKAGPAGLLALAPDVASELKLTDDQKQSLNALDMEMREKQYPGGAGAGVRAGPGGEGMERLRKVQEEYAAKAVEVLTTEQKEALNKFKGKVFNVSAPGVAGQFGIIR